MSHRLEPVSRAAAGLIAALHRACFPEDPWDAAAIEQIIGMPASFGLIGLAEDVAVGFALAFYLGTECEILSLGVVKSRRRAGIGSALLDCLCSEAHRRGAERVVLEVAVNNDAARALYAARGFTVIGHRRNYYRQAGGPTDAVVLCVALTRAPLAT